MASRTRKMVYFAVVVALLVAAVMAIARYQATIYLMPTPVVIGEGKVNPFAINPHLRPSGQLPILFATNRVPAGPKEERLYTIFPGDALHLGVINMQIGGEETTWEKLLSLSTTPVETNRPALRMRGIREIARYPIDGDALVTPAGKRALAELVNRAIARSIDKDLTIYVHGANTGLYRAAAQAAQYRHFTGRNSVVLVFLWPSAENLLGYGTDTRHAVKSAPAFAKLIELIADHTNAENINILAYSAGAQIVSPALDILGKGTTSESRQGLRLGQIYFAAGDIGVDTFVNHLLSYGDIPRATTIAMNRRDSVLTLATWREKVSRIGKPNLSDLDEQERSWVEDAVASSRLTVVEVSSNTVTGMRSRSHDFWFTHPWISSDILVQFLFHLPPSERGLVTASQDGGDIPLWIFPSDYPGKVAAVIERAVENQRNALQPPADSEVPQRPIDGQVPYERSGPFNSSGSRRPSLSLAM